MIGPSPSVTVYRAAITIGCVFVGWLAAGCAHPVVPERVDVPEATRPDRVVGEVGSAGVRVAYETFGEGAPLLIISGGFGSDSRGFEDLAQLLANDHRVVLFDRRGTGRSALAEPSAANITMDLVVADIEAIRTALGLETWNVLGHSFGGMVASHYTAMHPDRVERLVLSSSSGVDLHLFSMDARGFIQQRLDDADRAELSRIEAAYEAGDDSEALVARFSRILARAYVYDDAKADWVVRRLRRSDERIARLVTEDLERLDFDAKPALASFPRPVLVVQGRQDVMPLSISERAAGAFPDARLVVLEACGHYGWLDQEQTYVSTVLEFLER